MLELLARYWWVLLVRGLVAILFGICAFVWPGITLWVLVVLFAIFALVDGATAVYISLSGRIAGEAWWGMLAAGVLGILAGVIALAWPQITALALLYLIAAWAVLRGIFEIVAAVRLRHWLANEWMLGLAGAFSILFGVLLVLWPAAGILALLWLIGAFALLLGIVMVLLAFRLRSLGRQFA